LYSLLNVPRVFITPDLQPELFAQLFPVMLLGFFGSFGHCAGMCGPLVVAFSMSDSATPPPRSRWLAVLAALSFQLRLNLGRLIGYSVIGVILGHVGSAAIAGGQLLGVGSGFRQLMAIVTGLLLIWFGILNINPQLLPPIPWLAPIVAWLHRWLGWGMQRFAKISGWGSPILLGSLWGLIPCGFLFVAQLQAVSSGTAWLGGLTLLAFGLGTVPVMLGIGLSTTGLSADRRGQLFQVAGWLAIAIGVLTLLRTDQMVDWTGHGALLLLAWALAARPLARFWGAPLRYRRAIGVGAFFLALAHVAHQADHSFNWQLTGIRFMLPMHRYGLWAGITALLCLTPAAVTSFDRLQVALGRSWRRLHLLTIPGLCLATGHTIFNGSHYLGELARTEWHYGRSMLLVGGAIGVLALRLRPWQHQPISPKLSVTSNPSKSDSSTPSTSTLTNSTPTQSTPISELSSGHDSVLDSSNLSNRVSDSTLNRSSNGDLNNTSNNPKSTSCCQSLKEQSLQRYGSKIPPA